MAALTKDQLPAKAREVGRPQAREKPKPLNDTAILALLAAEKESSIGFENGTELEKKRTQALNYSKGVMEDVPSLENRSKAVSSDVEDAIQTILPDLMEIFTGGEDVAAFAPHGAEDEEGAKQETDYINWLAFQKLPGWRLLYTAIKDALQVDTGLIESFWQDKEETEEERFEGITVLQLARLKQEAGYTIVSAEPLPIDPLVGVQCYDVVAEKTYDKGCVKSVSFDPSNFSVAQDTVDLAETTYCVLRSYVRAQALVDQGFDPDKVAQLKEYTQKTGNENTEQARDTAGESTSAGQDSSGSGREDRDGKSLQRTVEVHKHWLRADLKSAGKSQLWRIQTDNECKLILDKREVEAITIAAGTPFIQTHRFYGLSLADKLVEIQKIKTALIRLMLDSGYFAMNQRNEVAEEKSNEHTIPDLLNNVPGAPVRSRTGDAVRPLQAGQLGFDPQMALEYVSTMAEGRSGVVRNAQGMNPDTLHETAKGAMALMTMAQKRVRMIARVLAETLVKKWFLDLHLLSRTHATQAEKIRLNGKWVDIDPSKFGNRADMVIEVGVGSGGKELEIANISQVLAFQKEAMAAAQAMGQPESPIATWQNIYNALKRFCERSGFKAPELFFTDPSIAAQQAEQEKAERAARGEPEPPPPPTPEQVEQQTILQKAQMETQAKQQQATAELQSKQTIEIEKAKIQAAADDAKANREHALRMAELAQKEKLELIRMANEKDLAERQMVLEQQTALQTAAISAKAQERKGFFANLRPGGDMSK